MTTPRAYGQAAWTAANDRKEAIEQAIKDIAAEAAVKFALVGSSLGIAWSDDHRKSAKYFDDEPQGFLAHQIRDALTDSIDVPDPDDARDDAEAGDE